ncbi:uncharacterized membrane protein At1g16860 [Cannabis sativa]|uniref:Uncharacterized protein n=1 Tax=Cannabis sativa TaxID=3483 RepID=A0A7J6GNL4_CANSA|nr:uncharacterized membrane protein At1g16860 [Cannabis sativa]KAF4384502.1 hypothetical protein F8388_003809 [Cannabis sativa]KAF4400961.1 hypothetical protein G4B88_013802 [Cannabis sativa]
MNDLSNGALLEKHCCTCKPIPAFVLYILTTLFLIGLSVSTFLLIAVRNATFLVSFLFLSSLVLAFLFWNKRNWRTKGAILFFLSSLPEADLRQAKEGQLVKITGFASCGSVSLRSSYERAPSCIYTSTLLYEYGGLNLNPRNGSCFQWGLTYCERFSTDFYITDKKSGLRAVVKAGSGCRVTPLVFESELVKTTRSCRILSPPLRKWLRERNLSDEARLLRLEEGYVQEGSTVSVVGIVHRNNDVTMIVQPSEVVSTGCLWQKLLLPVDIDGVLLSVSRMAVAGHSISR